MTAASAAVEKRGWRDPRWAAVCFGLVVVAAVPVILYLNRDQWFFLDEWELLSTRRLSPGDLLRPHNEHWLTVPVTLYRVLFRLVGLHHYWPYQLLTVTAHLVAATLLRVVMRRAGVPPWLATVAATVFVFFGTGRENIGWAFQVGFTGALAFGLGHLLLADHDGPFDRRDALGLGCGILALMSSGAGIAMTLVVAVAVLIRRGWRMALLHAAPLGAAYVAWFAAYGRAPSEELGASPSELIRFTRNAVEGTLRGLGQGLGVALALGVVLAVGAGMRIVGCRDAEGRRTYAATAGLLAGALSFIVLSGYSRAHISPSPASRYLHLLAAMVLPAIALAVADLARRWRPALVVGAALLLVGLPGNIRALEPTGAVRYTLGSPDSILVMAATPSPPGVPRSMHPLPLVAPGMTLGWLRDAHAAGRIPAPRPGSLTRRPSLVMAMSLELVSSAPTGRCVPHTGFKPVRLRRGDMLRIGSGAAVVRKAGAPPADGAPFYAASVTPMALDPGGDPEIRLVAETGPLSVSIAGTEAGSQVAICANGR